MKWHSPVSAVPFFLGKTDLPQDDRSAGSHPRREAEFINFRNTAASQKCAKVNIFGGLK
jgi:hypothetical protein